MVEIFDMQDDRVIINPNCLLIPEFKAVVDKYKDPVAALSYVHFMTHPMSPYNDVPEEEKQQIISDDVKGEFGLEDEEIEAALKKAELLYTTPMRRFFYKSKKGLETLGDYLGDTKITEGLHGNFASFQMAYTRIGKIIQEFKQLEKMYNEEQGSQNRGGAESAYDE